MKQLVFSLTYLLIACGVFGQAALTSSDWASVVHRSARVLTATVERKSYVMKPEWKNLEHKVLPEGGGRYKNKEILEMHLPQQDAVGRLYQLQILESLKGQDHVSEISVYLPYGSPPLDSGQPVLKEKESYVFFLAPLSTEDGKNLQKMRVLTGETMSPFQPSAVYTLVDYKVLEMNSPAPTVDEIRAIASQAN